MDTSMVFSILKHKGFISVGMMALSVMSGCSTKYSSLPAASIQPSLTENVSNYKYLIGPGDQLNVFVWGNDEVSGTYQVRPDGKISTSLVEDIQASGRTPTDLARSLEVHLAEYIREPIVNVIVSGFVGPYSEQVRVIGEATNPKAINYRENMTLLDVMIEVGGLTEYADGNDAKLIRVENNQQKQYSLKMGDLVRDGNIRANVDILPGDVIFIPESWF